MSKKYAYLHWASYLVCGACLFFGLSMIASAFLSTGFIGFWEFVKRIIFGLLITNAGFMAGAALEDKAEEAWKEFMK